jgi:hypothetical protein
VNRNYDDPQPNIPLLRKGLEWVEWQASLPEIDREWHQDSWIIPPEDRAGIMADDILGNFAHPDLDWNQVEEQVEAHCGTAYCFAGYVAQLCDKRYAADEEVNEVHVSDYAREQLGLTKGQAGRLFSCDNSARSIRLLCEEFAGEAL